MKKLMTVLFLTFFALNPTIGVADNLKSPAVKSEPLGKAKLIVVTASPDAAIQTDLAVKDSEPVKANTVAEQETLNAWQLSLKHLMELAFLVLSIMATVLVRVMMKKYGFEEYSVKVNDILTKAVGFAEQWSIKKAKLGGEPTIGSKKMELAVDFAKKLATEYKLPDKGSEWWERKLEGWLGAEKVKANATKSVAS